MTDIRQRAPKITPDQGDSQKEPPLVQELKRPAAAEPVDMRIPAFKRSAKSTLITFALTFAVLNLLTFAKPFILNLFSAVNVPVPSILNAHRMFEASELLQYDGTDETKPIYLAVFGKIYDVTSGRRFYGPEAGPHYHFFAGKDGSRAFSTGEFKGTSDRAPHDCADLTNDQLVEIMSWQSQYESNPKYGYVGRVWFRDNSGYYDQHGNPTELLFETERRISQGNEIGKQRIVHQKLYPGCNSQYSQGIGGKLWCDHGRVPRLGKLPLDRDTRCACYEKEYAKEHSTLLRIPDNCTPDMTECRIEPRETL